MTSIKHHQTSKVLQLLKQGKYASEIARELGLDRSTVAYHIGKLKAAGQLEEGVRSSIQTFQTFSTKSSYPTRNPSQGSPSLKPYKEVHDIFISLPILERPAQPPEGLWKTVNEGLKNNVQRHADFKEIGASVRETSQSICIQLRPRKLRSYDQIYGFILGAMSYVSGVLAGQGYVLDFMRPAVKGLHLVYGDEHSRELLDKGIRVRTSLGRERARFFDGDPHQEAYVLLDTTPTKNWETNDHDHARLRAIEPELVAQIAESMKLMAANQAVYAEHLASHVKFIAGAAGVMRKLESRLDQKKLREYL